jgi:ribosome-binding ATPase
VSLKCGIVGLPNVGKSTLFNALSNAKAEAANYPFCTIDPNVAMVEVPDHRLDVLEELVVPQRVVRAVVSIVDIAGLVKGASSGEGRGNAFLTHIRETDAILHVLRCFQDPNVIHVEGSVSPIRDKEIIEIELQLKDLDTLEKREKSVRAATKGGNKDAQKNLDCLERLIAYMQRGQNARSFQRDEQEYEFIQELFLLTDKPVLYVCNVSESDLPDGATNPFVQQVKEMAATEGAGVAVICAAAESQIAELDSPEERREFLEMLGVQEPGLNTLLRKAYTLLGLQTYFTAGVKEVRAWTIPVGTKAPLAAAVIHSDFEKHFIRAEVIGYEDFAQFRSEAAVKDAGKLRVEGKEYVVKDGDVLHFRTSA